MRLILDSKNDVPSVLSSALSGSTRSHCCLTGCVPRLHRCQHPNHYKQKNFSHYRFNVFDRIGFCLICSSVKRRVSPLLAEHHFLASALTIVSDLWYSRSTHCTTHYAYTHTHRHTPPVLRLRNVNSNCM